MVEWASTLRGTYHAWVPSDIRQFIGPLMTNPGLYLILPFIWFLARREIPRRLILRYFGLLALGGLQGLVGWWMVKSGLENRVSVAPERLATHLALALFLFGALIWCALEAWAGQKSFKRKGRPSDPPDDPGNPTVNFHGERRSNQTHASTTDPESRLFKKAKGHEAKLAYLGEVLMENRHGLVVDACVVPATGTGERDAATSLIASLPHRRVTIGGDKGYDTCGFVETLRTLDATPHVALKAKSRTLDRRTTRHPGYTLSQVARKRIEEVFGWMKTVGGLRKLRHRGGARVNWQFLLAAAAYNLVRIRTIEGTA